MPTTITLTKEFLDDFEQSTDTGIENLALMTTIEMKKLAPFAKPSQYAGKYPGTPGTLVKSIERKNKGKNSTIESSVPYAIIRNYINKLNPQTKLYIQRGIENVLRGKSSQWWQATKNQGR